MWAEILHFDQCQRLRLHRYLCFLLFPFEMNVKLVSILMDTQPYRYMGTVCHRDCRRQNQYDLYRHLHQVRFQSKIKF